MRTVDDEAPPTVRPTTGPAGRGAARPHHVREPLVVWVHSPLRLISEALLALLAKAGCEGESGTSAPSHADIAVWDLRRLAPPYPLPPDIPTLALVGGSDAAKLGALSAGYRGYLSGEETADELGRALLAVLRGDVWAERSLLSRLVMSPSPPALTKREEQVLALLLQGLPNKGIAERLGLAEKTVKVYVSELLYKHGAKNRAELILRRERERPFEHRAKHASRANPLAP